MIQNANHVESALPMPQMWLIAVVMKKTLL